MGALSQPVGTRAGFYLIQVVDKAEARRIEAEDRESLKDRALERWFLEERKENRITRHFDSDKYALALKQVRNP